MISRRPRPARSSLGRPVRPAFFILLGLALLVVALPAGAAATGSSATAAVVAFPWDQPWPTAPPAPKKTGEYDLIGSSVRMIGALGVVLGLIFVVLWVIRRFFTQRPLVAGGQVISILAARHIAPKKQIVVVEVEGHKLVLGLAGDSITYLTRLGPSAESDRSQDRGPAEDD
jgi:flagellar biosynthetic protein FliO